MTGDAIRSTQRQTFLGEGLRWDARSQELLAVDILAGQVYRARVADDGSLSPVCEYWLPGTVGAIVPVHDDEGWLLAAGRGFVYLTPDGSVRPLAEVAPVGSRMNDGVCDPQGRLWAGSLAEDFREGGGALHRLDRNGRIDRMLEGLTIPNGLGWSADGATMYLADSATHLIHAFSFNADDGTLSDPRVFVRIGEELGAPDGLTVDVDGDLWVAIYEGAQVRRYSPDGVLRETLSVPASQTTSCAFAGSALNRLYVTTATEGWSDEQRRAQPSAGLIYRFDTESTGRPVDPFRPDPAWWAKVRSGR
jgi:sugar lactone lactonase YvrE